MTQKIMRLSNEANVLLRGHIIEGELPAGSVRGVRVRIQGHIQTTQIGGIPGIPHRRIISTSGAFGGAEVR